MITLSPVPVEKVRSVWDYVRKGLVSGLEKIPDRWIPEDVYLALQSKAAFLYMIELDADPVGFTVLKPFSDFDGMALHIWVLWAEPNSMETDDRYKEVLAQLDALGKQIGAKRLRQYSPRGGWLAKGMFELKMHLYEREL